MRNQELLHHLDLAMIRDNPEETAVDDFALNLFRMLGYERGQLITRARKNLRLPLCGELRHAKTDICLLDCHQNDKMLLVQENKHLMASRKERDNAEVQLVAEAIAASHWNSSRRQGPPLDLQVRRTHF